MKRDEEDEIQILGTSSAPKRKPNWKITALITVGLLIAVIGIYYLSNSNKEEECDETDLLPVAEKKHETFHLENSIRQTSQVKFSKDSINDVPLNIYLLDNLYAELSLQKPATDDTTVYFVLQAADVRKDRKGIVGDFVLKGEQLATGKRKTGYCAITNGKITIGNSLNDEIKDRCLSQQADFFRQYPLVINGEIQENKLKGKAVRRALAQLGNDFYIVISCNRESLYDFSEALSDIGFTNALYLVGGSAYGWWREDPTTIHELISEEDNRFPGANYIIFKKQQNE